MKSRIIRMFDRNAPQPGAHGPLPPPRPDEPFLAIGDVHGRADLVIELDGLVEAECPGRTVVFLGDYVDRGEHSREVLELLMALSPDSAPPVICLAGNHESMMLEFLDQPETAARRWLRNGGLQTLASFGAAPPAGGLDDPETLVVLRDRLACAMGDEMIAWLRARPLMWHSGNVWAVHAGADPDLPMAEQAPQTLLWGHAGFLRGQRSDGQWVVHGHTVVDRPQVRDGRIAVDTGAYATGRLSAAIIASDGVRFLRTGAD